MTERMLNGLGVTTCADLYEKRAILHLLFSQVSVQSFLYICLGIGSSEVCRYGTNASLYYCPTYCFLYIIVNMREKVLALKGIMSIQLCRCHIYIVSILLL